MLRWAHVWASMGSGRSTRRRWRSSIRRSRRPARSWPRRAGLWTPMRRRMWSKGWEPLCSTTRWWTRRSCGWSGRSWRWHARRGCSEGARGASYYHVWAGAAGSAPTAPSRRASTGRPYGHGRRRTPARSHVVSPLLRGTGQRSGGGSVSGASSGRWSLRALWRRGAATAAAARLSGGATGGLVAPAKDGACLGLVSMCEQPALGFVMHGAQVRAGGDHHPQCGFGVGGVAGLPLAFGNQEGAQGIGILLSQHIVQPRAERFVAALVSAHLAAPLSFQ